MWKYTYRCRDSDTQPWIKVEVEDRDGKQAWSKLIEIWGQEPTHVELVKVTEIDPHYKPDYSKGRRLND